MPAHSAYLLGFSFLMRKINHSIILVNYSPQESFLVSVQKVGFIMIVLSLSITVLSSCFFYTVTVILPTIVVVSRHRQYRNELMEL